MPARRLRPRPARRSRPGCRKAVARPSRPRRACPMCAAREHATCRAAPTLVKRASTSGNRAPRSCGGLLTRSVIAEIIEVDAEDDDRIALRRQSARARPSARPCTRNSDRRRYVDRPRCASRRSELRSSRDPNRPQCARNRRVRTMPTTATLPSHTRTRSTAERVVGHPRQKRRVGAAAERDDHPLQLAQLVAQRGEITHRAAGPYRTRCMSSSTVHTMPV